MYARMAPGFPNIRNELYCAILARHVEPASSGAKSLRDAMRRVRDANVDLPDLVVAGRLLSVPACYGFDNGTARMLGTRPFLRVDGNRPLFSEDDNSLGTGLVHMISTLEEIELGSLPWFEMIHESLEGKNVELWGPEETFEKTGGS